MPAAATSGIPSTINRARSDPNIHHWAGAGDGGVGGGEGGGVGEGRGVGQGGVADGWKGRGELRAASLFPMNICRYVLLSTLPWYSSCNQIIRSERIHHLPF